MVRRKVIVNRKTWLRGEGSAVSKLLRSGDNKMCCLGFVCKQLLQERNADILNVGGLTIQQIDIFGGTITKAYQINDSRIGVMPFNSTLPRIVSEQDREERLIRLFAENNIELTFIG